MQLETAAFNSDASKHSALTEEKAFVDCVIEHEFMEPARATIILDDPDGKIAQKYDVSSGAVGGAVADDGGAETDETTEANEDTDDDMTLLPAAPELNDAYYIGFADPFPALDLNVSTAADAVGLFVITWEYSTGSDAWSALSGVTDGTDKYQNAGVNTISWTVPSDWATDEVGSIADLYWVRGRLTDNAAWTVVPVGAQAWIGGVYIGPGRAKIEIPTGTCLFEGRILKVRHDRQAATAIMVAEDWLSQLDEDRENYDMREDLDGSGLRQSEIHTVITEDKEPVYTSDANYYMFDGDMDWDIDEWNGKYVILSNEMAGNIVVNTGPWEETIAGGIDSDLPADGELNVWSSISTCHAMQHVPTTYFAPHYYFKMYVTEGTLGAANASKCTLEVVFKFDSDGTGAYTEVWIYNFNTTDWIKVGTFNQSDEYAVRSMSFEANWPSGSNFAAHAIDSDGKAQIRFRCYTGDADTDTLDFDVYTIRFKADIVTSGHISAISITDTLRGHADGGATYNTLKVGTDLSIANLGLWEGCQYSIVKPIKDHINAIVTGGDSLFTLDTSIEATDGLTNRHYEERTRLEMLRDLGDMDRAVCWIALADHTTPTLIWKRTFNDGSPTEMTDASVISWVASEWDYTPMVNEYHVYGIRVGDEQLYVDTSSLSPDPGVDSKALFGATRSAVKKNTGTTSTYETTELGKALVERDEDVHLYLRATIAGLSSLRLGSEVNINSTILGLTDEKYVITHWVYDSKAYQTTIRLHPRQSIGFIKHKMFGDYLYHLSERAKLTEADKGTPSLATQTWT